MRRGSRRAAISAKCLLVNRESRPYNFAPKSSLPRGRCGAEYCTLLEQMGSVDGAYAARARTRRRLAHRSRSGNSKWSAVTVCAVSLGPDLRSSKKPWRLAHSRSIWRRAKSRHRSDAGAKLDSHNPAPRRRRACVRLFGRNVDGAPPFSRV